MVIIKDRNRWNELVSRCKYSDFYHTYDYHILSKEEDESPILINYELGNTTICIPLLVRNIPGTNLKDATSVYGYVGPISNKEFDTDIDLIDFQNKLKKLLMENRIVSVFSRLHPFIQNQRIVLKGVGKIINNGQVVNIDVTQNFESQKRQYNRRLKSYVNKAKSLYDIKKCGSAEFVDTFRQIYFENMKRVGAKPNYFFSRKYFLDLLESPQINASLFLAIDKETEEIAAGAIFTKTNGIVQYHLSGVREKYLKVNPIKYIIDFVRVQITEEGKMKYFNLGGGIGGSDDDSLFKFKSGFSKDYKSFDLWKYIVDEDQYWSLVKERILDKKLINQEKEKDSAFFPLYRLNCN